MLKCHGGCSVDDICSAIGINPRDLFVAKAEPTNGHRRNVVTYDYCDETGALLFQVVRTDPKGFY